MKKLFMAILAITLLASYASAGQDHNSYRDCWGANRYNRHQDSLTRDFDNDGIPNAIDPFDNEFHMPPGLRDYDNDGTPNIVDPYDDDWHKP